MGQLLHSRPAAVKATAHCDSAGRPAEVDHLRAATDRCLGDPVLRDTICTSTTTDGSGGGEGYVLRNTIDLGAAGVGPGTPFVVHGMAPGQAIRIPARISVRRRREGGFETEANIVCAVK